MSKDASSRRRWRLRVYPLAVVAAIGVAIVLGSVTASRSSAPAGVVGGDYPAFYGAGRIAAAGDWDHLYDPGRQVAAQAGLYPEDEGEVARLFPYPPQVALLYRPLAALDYSWSYLIHTVLMGLLLWITVLLVRPMLPWLRGREALGVAAALCFWPMFRAVTGGSNTALTLFLIVAAWRLVHDDRPVLAGLVLAGLAYKPQFALPMIGLYLVARHLRVVGGAAVGAVGFYLAGVPLQGWGWGRDWYDMVTSFGNFDAVLNGHSAISFVGFAENIVGVSGSPLVTLAWVLAAAVAVVLAWLWWRSRGEDLVPLLAITMPGLLLLSPHAMSHDGAIVVLTAAIMVSRTDRRSWLPWIVVVWLLGASQLFIKQLGFSPGLPMLLLIVWWVSTTFGPDLGPGSAAASSSRLDEELDVGPGGEVEKRGGACDVAAVDEV